MNYVIYETTNLVNGRCYRGAHSTKDLNDGYIGSGKLLKRAIDKYGKEKFERRILFNAFSSDDMYEIEKEFVDEEWVSDKSTYNLKIGGFGGFDHLKGYWKGRTLSEESRRKLSEANKGENHPNWGKPHSEETRKKMSEAQKGKCVGENHHFYGKTHSDETKRKMSEAQKGKPKQKITCPHCNKTGGSANMKRYHFHNCKQKETTKC